MVKNLVLLLVGAGIGATGSYLYLKKKYAEETERGVESVKAYYEAKYTASKNEEEKMALKVAAYEKKINEEEHVLKQEPIIVSEVEKKTKEEAEVIMKTEDYTRFSSSKVKSEEKTEDKPFIYVISDQQWDMDLGNDKVIVSYYHGDGVLADDDGELSIDDTIGRESLKHFGEYEEDILYVRNDILGIDYQVVKEYSSYSDMFEDK